MLEKLEAKLEMPRPGPETFRLKGSRERERGRVWWGCSNSERSPKQFAINFYGVQSVAAD